MKTMTTNEFFRELVAENNYMDGVTVREIYYSILRLIIKELKRSGKIVLVDLGTLKVHNMKSRNIHDINTGRRLDISSKKIVKFKPSEKLRVYVRDNL